MTDAALAPVRTRVRTLSCRVAGFMAGFTLRRKRWAILTPPESDGAIDIGDPGGKVEFSPNGAVIETFSRASAAGRASSRSGARAHVRRQRPGPASRNAPRRLPVRCCDRTGAAGPGITDRAFDTQLAKFVAIKRIPRPIEFAIRREGAELARRRGSRFADDFTWGTRDRFLDEAGRALARFRHPHIVPVLRYFEANGTAYTVMEFEDGQNARRAPARSQPAAVQPMSPENVQRLAEALLSGLRAVHAENFLHRDIKPSNIIVRTRRRPVLIDFGAARRRSAADAHADQRADPAIRADRAGCRDSRQGLWSDIYSAAAVLYHAITSQLPVDQAAARVGADPGTVRSARPPTRFDPAFLAAIDRALAFAPGDRPR